MTDAIERLEAAIVNDDESLTLTRHEIGYLLLKLRQRGSAGREESERSLDTAPKDGTMLRLLVVYDERDEHDHPLNDEAWDSPEGEWTIGFNSLENTGEDEWTICGWWMDQDTFINGKGRVLGWLPYEAALVTTSAGGEGEREGRIADLLNRSEEDWDKLEDAIATVASFRAGRTLTEEDIAALSLVQQEHDADDEGATEAYHRGLVDGRSEGGGADTAALLEKLDDYRVRLSTEKALSRFDALFGVRRGAAHCREVMARFVEQGGDATTANSIRHNWNAAWGEDPGAGVTLDEAEALAAPASPLGEGVVEALAKIANWREECHACDRDMGHPLRDFDDEDWDLVELCARNALRKARTILARVEGDLGKEGNGSRAVPCQEAETPAWNQSAALWRRGMMHAVERLDRVVGPQQKIPRTAKAMRAMLDGVHEELCALVEFQRDHRPQNYEEAFQLCEAELAARFPPSEPSTGRLGHKNPTPESKG